MWSEETMIRSGSDGSGISNSGRVLFPESGWPEYLCNTWTCVESEKVPMLKAGDIMLNGHTHVPACEEIRNRIRGLCNVHESGIGTIPKERSNIAIWSAKMVYLNGKI